MAKEIQKALENGQVDKVVSKVDVNGVVTTFRVDVNGKIVDPWP